MVVLGPGTGLGVAAYVPCAAGGFVLRSEGGHGTMPSGSLREDAIIENLRQRFGHVSAERVLSGQGLENLYRAIASIDALTVPERTAAEITQAAVEGSCATSRAALDMFCAMLGEVAGNFALSFGAQGGVFIAGGIVPQIRDYLPQIAVSLPLRGEGADGGLCRANPGLPDLARRSGVHRFAVACRTARLASGRMMTMAEIVTLTPNPAIDLSTSVDRIVPMRKLRCAPQRRDPGGGGVNVARVVKRFGGDVEAILPVGGFTGQLLRRLIDDEGIPNRVIAAEGETREDFSVSELSTAQQYRFVLPGQPLREVGMARVSRSAGGNRATA